MKLFLANVTWYPTTESDAQTDTCYIFANTLADACDKLDSEFSWIENIILKVINDDTANSILFIPSDAEKVMEVINNANSY